MTALTRRALLAVTLAGAGQAALAKAPLTAPRPLPRGMPAPVILRPDAAEALVREAGLQGAVGFVLADADSGDIRSERAGNAALPPASTLKAVTALYALERLGPTHRFGTRLLGTGPIVDGRLDGDLVLLGDGDPTLDTDRLKRLVDAMVEGGVTEVAGRLLLWDGALPEIDRIDPGQPEQVGYNPAIGGLNLNFNRVHFGWKRNGDGYDISMQARGATATPEVRVARMSIVDRTSPVYAYRDGGTYDSWTVRRAALGGEGARWLPVRYPTLYVGDVFRSLAREAGVTLPKAEVVDVVPEGRELASVEGPELSTLLRGMLKYSTNLTAEVTGLAASLANGVPVADLQASGSRMAGWAMERYGIARPTFRDHSGLGYGSEVSPLDMSSMLSAARGTQLPQLLKPVNLALNKSTPAPSGVRVVAKTGTLNFVSALAGYLDRPDGTRQVFAILTADRDRRDAIPVNQRERPQGGREWARRSRLLQKRLLRLWGANIS